MRKVNRYSLWEVTSHESATLRNGATTVLLEAAAKASGPEPAAGPATRDTPFNRLIFVAAVQMD